MNTILSHYSASISELKKNPSQLIEDAHGEPVAILNHNKPTAYLIPANTYEQIQSILEDYELGKIVVARQGEKGESIEVSLDDL
jgi:antitoxin StbD